MDVLQTCPSCKENVSSEYFFCPMCGKKLREKPLSTSFGRQLGVYVISFLFPPFGLGSAFNYLRQPRASAKVIGVIAILLTSASLMMISYQMMEVFSMIAPLLNSASTMSQLSGY